MSPRKAFGDTWWGQAWIQAVEGRAVHDPNRLPRGRTYARQGSVGDLRVEPGEIRARVMGSRPDPYDVLLAVRELRDDEWDCVLDAIVAKAAHAAALLDGELDPAIVTDARDVEVELLPVSGDLRTACSCPDDAEPCKHAAAVCYQMARTLDDDPFVLFTVRGMPRSELMDAIRARRSAGSGVAAEAGAEEEPADAVTEGVDAAQAWARTPGPLPVIPPPAPDAAARVAAWPSDPPDHAPFDRVGLELLAGDAARRARRVRAGDATSGLELDERTDLARRAAGAADGELATLAFRSGVLPAALEAQAVAWELGGAGGVEMLDAPTWAAPVLTMAEAKETLVEAGFRERQLRVRANRITVGGDLQFRLGLDRRWYRFEKPSGRWMLTAPPSDELDDVVDA